MAANRRTAYYINNRLEELHNQDIIVESREIFLIGDNDGDNPETDKIMAHGAIKNIRFLSELSDDGIVVHQFNTGGDVDCGFAIYDALKLCKCHVTIICHGSCQSMATIITQAADTRLAMPSCYFMLHEGSHAVDNTYKSAMSAFKQSEIAMKAMIDIYIDKFKHSEKYKGYTEARLRRDIQQKLDQKGDWYLMATEAKEYGLIDDVIGVTKYKNLGEAIYA